METAVLAFVIAALLAYLGWSHYQFVEHIRRLSELHKAKDLNEVANLEMVRKAPEEEPKEPEERELNTLTNDQFMQLITKQLDGEAGH